MVGARCAGAPTALKLAQHGHKVLLVEKDPWPSNMPMSTHLIHPHGVAYLKRWGLHDAILARAPGTTRWWVDLHGVVLDGTPPAVEGNEISYAPRRALLDAMLVDAAVDAGAEFRPQFRVVDLMHDDDGVCGIRGKPASGPVAEERARIVIGADGPASVVARCVGAPESHQEPVVQSNIWSYWRGVPVDHVRLYIREEAGAFAFPSSDDMVLVAANLMYPAFVEARRDRATAYYAMLARAAPELRAMVDAAEQVDRFYAGCTRAFVRPAWGPGWALVGDAGMKKDPVTAQGISSAFEYAEKLAAAIHCGLSGAEPMDDALTAYERERDTRMMPFYRFTAQLSRFAKPTPALRAEYERIQADPRATRDLFGAVALSVSPDVALPPPA